MLFFRANSDRSDPEFLLKIINNNLSRSVTLAVPFIEVLFTNILVFGVLGALVYSVFYYRDKLINPWLWFYIAIGSQFVFTSGIIACHLTGSPLFPVQ